MMRLRLARHPSNAIRLRLSRLSFFAHILLFLFIFPPSATAEGAVTRDDIKNKSPLDATGDADTVPDDYRVVKARYERTLRASARIGDWPAVGAMWQRIARLEQDFGKTALARHAYGAALLLAEKHDLGWLAFSVQWDLSKLELAVKRYEQARIHLGKALDIAIPGSNFGRIARGPLLFDYAMLHIHSRQYDIARQLLKQSLTYFDTPSEKVARANVLRSLGKVEGLRNHNNAARAALDEAIGIYREKGKHILRAATLAELGDLEHRQGNINGARVHYLEALRIYEQRKETSSIAVLRKKLEALKRDAEPPGG